MPFTVSPTREWQAMPEIPGAEASLTLNEC